MDPVAFALRPKGVGDGVCDGDGDCDGDVDGEGDGDGDDDGDGEAITRPAVVAYDVAMRAKVSWGLLFGPLTYGWELFCEGQQRMVLFVRRPHAWYQPHETEAKSSSAGATNCRTMSPQHTTVLLNSTPHANSTPAHTCRNVRLAGTVMIAPVQTALLFAKRPQIGSTVSASPVNWGSLGGRGGM
jgi:hypothetical protein